jgi:hypothetical protein
MGCTGHGLFRALSLLCVGWAVLGLGWTWTVLCMSWAGNLLVKGWSGHYWAQLAMDWSRLIMFWPWAEQNMVWAGQDMGWAGQVMGCAGPNMGRPWSPLPGGHNLGFSMGLSGHRLAIYLSCSFHGLPMG